MAAAVAVSPSPSRRWWTSYTSMATPCRIPTLVNMNILWMYFLLALLRLDLCGGLPRTVRIGGIFEQEFRSQELVFKYAIEKINSRRDLLPFTKLTYDVKETPRDDSFVSAKHVCRQMKDGVAAIFGPMSDHSAAHVQSICDALEIPHVETRWDFRQDWDSYSINLYPHYRTLSRAYNDIITIWRWKSFTILYQTNEGLVRLQDLLRGSSSQQVQVTVRRLEPTDEGDYRPIFKEIEKRGETRIVIDCEYYEVHEILKQAQSLAMMTQYYHYFLTTLDLHLVDLSDYQYGGSNITGLRLVDPENPRVIQVTNEWQQIHDRTGLSPLENERGFRTATALMYDAVHVFARGLDDLSRAQDIEVTPLSCNRRNGWEYGNSLLNYMKMAEVDGLTGRVRYDNDGLRTRVVLELVELGNGQLEKVGYWDWRTGVNITKDYSKVQETVAASLQNKTLVVTTILEAPYVMLKNEEGLEGNDRYEGFCVDMLKEIADIIKFNYTIREVADGQYGAPAEDGETWSGMVGELITKKADLAVASLTISYIREQVIDFTKPFMNLGISILFKVPEKQNPSLFSFLSPLSFDIWIYMLAAYLVVSFMLFVLARFSPYEWYNPHPCNPDSDVVENQFTLLNSLWFTIGSLMQQGSEVAPRAISTRLVSGMWWFFTLIMISSYTANLAAFLTVERMTSPIENQDDLARQTEIKYGPVYGGSTMTFFKNSHIQTYEKMWHFMSSTKPSVFVNSTKEGIERVRKGNYAYLVESTMNEYVTARNCDLMQVGGLLDSKGYGIGTPRGSPYRDLISNAILKLAESQTLQHLYNVWWKEKGAKQCQQDEKKKDANALAIANVGGVFVVLLAGLFLSLIVAVLEFMWKTNKNADVDREPICKEMADELRFAVRCLGSSKKPVKKRRYAEPPVNLPPDYYVDTNGTTLMPLTGGMIMPKKESYA